MTEIFEHYWEHKNFRDEASKNVNNTVHKIWKLSKSSIVSPAHNFFFREIENCKSILDFGAGELDFKDFVLTKGYKGIYKTFDINKSFNYDYNNIEEIHEKFDSICAFEVIEHIPVKDCISLFRKFYELLNEGGKLIITTPNIHHINFFWKTDYTHISHYPYEDLYALLREAGFSKVTLYRFYNQKPILGLYGKFKYYVKRILTHFLEVDYATNIGAIAIK